MDERVARLQAHQNNIDRYQGLLKTSLSETEKQYLEKRLSEERFAIAMLDFSTGAVLSEPAERDRKALSH